MIITTNEAQGRHGKKRKGETWYLLKVIRGWTVIGTAAAPTPNIIRPPPMGQPHHTYEDGVMEVVVSARQREKEGEVWRCRRLLADDTAVQETFPEAAALSQFETLVQR